MRGVNRLRVNVCMCVLAVNTLYLGNNYRFDLHIGRGDETKAFRVGKEAFYPLPSASAAIPSLAISREEQNGF